MQYNIELGNHCFEPIVRINNSDIMIQNYDDYKLNQDSG